MTEHQKNEPLTPDVIAKYAGDAVRHLQESSPLSLLEMAAVFRVAGSLCDESSMMIERVEMTAKLRNYRLGGK